MTHFPGFPSLISQGQEEWEQAGSHTAGPLQCKKKFRLARQEYLSTPLFMFTCLSQKSFPKKNKTCTCP